MQVPAPTAEPRPRLVVVYGHRSLSALQIAEAARGWCDLVWLVDGQDRSVASVIPLLRRLGVVVDALAAAPEAAAKALRAYSPDGLVTFYDRGMEHVAEIASELKLRFHSPEAARGLEDKLYQRQALRFAGLPGPATVALPPGAERATVEQLGASIRYPAVLKPRKGDGSWHTFPISSVSALGDLWEQLEGEGPEARVAEEYLADGPPMPGGFEADYVSVETVAAAGEMTHLAITGRFPLVPPFRETGFFIPATIQTGDRASTLELAGRALRALGVDYGAAHTEIKLTAAGPRIIEVNGRVGGGIPDLLRLSGGVDIVRLTMQAALGFAVELDDLPRPARLAYRFFFQPPESAGRLTMIDGLDELRLLPGVESIFLHYPPGTEIDVRHGTRAYVFSVFGSAADYAGMLAIERFLRTGITVGYDPR